jgi:hypothetical protein
MHFCSVCNYMSIRKDNYDRHMMSNKHIKKESNNSTSSDKNDNFNIEQVSNDLKKESNNSTSSDKNDKFNIEQISKEKTYKCSKCFKGYQCKKRLILHKEKCRGVDSLTCSVCMKTFSHSSHKSRHEKKRKCKATSIYKYYQSKDVFEMQNYVMDYRNETNMYIDNNFCVALIKTAANCIIQKYVENKHFNALFPENQNVKCLNNKFMIKQQGKWNCIHRKTLADKLYNDCGYEFLQKIKILDSEIKAAFPNKSDYEDVMFRANYIELETYGYSEKIKRDIIDLVKSTSSVKSEYS